MSHRPRMVRRQLVDSMQFWRLHSTLRRRRMTRRSKSCSPVKAPLSRRQVTKGNWKTAASMTQSRTTTYFSWRGRRKFTETTSIRSAESVDQSLRMTRLRRGYALAAEAREGRQKSQLDTWMILRTHHPQVGSRRNRPSSWSTKPPVKWNDRFSEELLTQLTQNFLKTTTTSNIVVVLQLKTHHLFVLSSLSKCSGSRKVPMT